jgi:hypothetical protein
MQQSSLAWDELVKDRASESALREHLAKLAEILSESSYIRNLEKELEGEKSH